MAAVRLHKFMSASGVASLRASESLISQGLVFVNGIPAALGARVVPGQDVVEVVQEGGRNRRRVEAHPALLQQETPTTLSAKWQHTYLALNKPRGVITSMHDPEGRPCLVDIVRQPVNWRVLTSRQLLEGRRGGEEGAVMPTRLMHVGRLDFNTSGLILLTDDGSFAQAVAHPRHRIAKRYEVGLPGRVGQGEMEGVVKQLLEGVQLEDGPARADDARVLPQSSLQAEGQYSTGSARPRLELTIHDGRNRIVRRMLQACGFPAIALIRTCIGPIALRPDNGSPPLLPGRMRFLTQEEVDSTRALAAVNAPAEAQRTAQESPSIPVLQ